MRDDAGPQSNGVLIATRRASGDRSVSGIKEIVAIFGMPDTEPSQRYDKFIEVQVWDDGPIERILNEAMAMGSTALRKS